MDASVREPIISTLIIIVIASSFLAAIPYFFVTLDQKKMKRIRASLERKKVLADLSLTDAPEEVCDAAYAQYLADKEAEADKAAAKAQAEKEALRLKQREAAEKEAAFRRELDEIAATGAADGKSEREIKREIDERKRMRKEEKRAAVKAAFEKMRADQKALNRRKKRFCADWIAQAKAEGKKKWLHVLAREAFSRELAREADLTDDVRAENGGSA